MSITWHLYGDKTSFGPLKKDDVVAVFRQAFKMWQDASYGLVFVEEDNTNVDIVIKFARGMHSDPYPFGTDGKTFAHAFPPHDIRGINGDIHFNEYSLYSLKSTMGTNATNLLWAATHEIGEIIHVVIQTIGSLYK